MSNIKNLSTTFLNGLIVYLIPALARFLSSLGSVLTKPFLSEFPSLAHNLWLNIISASVAGFLTSLVLAGPSLHVKYSARFSSQAAPKTSENAEDPAAKELQTSQSTLFWRDILIGMVIFGLGWLLLLTTTFSAEP